MCFYRNEFRFPEVAIISFASCHFPSVNCKRSKESNFSISRFSKVYRSTTLFFFRRRLFRCSPCPCLFLEHNSQSQSLIGRTKFPACTISKVFPLRKQGQICLSVDRACFFTLSVRATCAYKMKSLLYSICDHKFFSFRIAAFIIYILSLRRMRFSRNVIKYKFFRNVIRIFDNRN